MVYCGKPAGGCERCRKRRIKCDKREPGCTQCLRKSVTCSGYRDPVSVLFRDETTSVIKKYHDEHKETEDEYITLSWADDQTSTGFCSPQSLCEPIHEIAACHFVNSFVPGSHFDYIPELYNTTVLGTPLQSSIHAAALANLARERCEPEMMQAAQSYYGKALKQTKKALLSEKAGLDTTLVSVLILSLYETIALSDKLSTKSWETHTEGAVSLLELRGLQSLQTGIGRKLYIQVSNNIRVSCVQRAAPLPRRFVDLDRKASEYLDLANPVLQFWPIVDAYIHLQIMDQARDLYEPLEILGHALTLEQMLVQITENLGSSGVWETVESEDTAAEAVGVSPHRYTDHRVARLWNTIRMTRIFVNEILYEQSFILMRTQSPAESKSWASIQFLADKTAKDAAAGILASVPPFIQKSGTQNPQPLRVSTVSGFVWPLSAVAASNLVSFEARDYAIQSLSTIGRDAKLLPAIRAADKIEMGMTDRLSWQHLLHLA